MINEACSYLQLFLVAFVFLMVYYYRVTKCKKLIDRFLSKPKDFTWNELIKVLSSFGYKQIKLGKTSGSRARFIHLNYPPIILHIPHPKPILKRYQLEEIINLLIQEKLL